MSTLPAITIDSKSQNEILTNLRRVFSGNSYGGICFFRRFSAITFPKQTLPQIATRHLDVNDHQEVFSNNGFGKKELQRHYEIKYPGGFRGVTTSHSLRSEPSNLRGKNIHVDSHNFMFMNEILEFESCTAITPVEDDLIFVFMSYDNLRGVSKYNYANADKWFIASEQFMKAWTLIMYDWHETFDKLIPKNTPAKDKEDSLKSKCFSGNRLVTNTWLKYKISADHSKKEWTDEESRSRYWFLRTEYLSTQYNDVYAAIVLIARYGELPCPCNVPNTKGTSTNNQDLEAARRESWCLPYTFVTQFLTIYSSQYRPDLLSIKNYELWNEYCETTQLFYSFNFIERGFVDEINKVRCDFVDGEIKDKNEALVKKTESVNTQAEVITPIVKKNYFLEIAMKMNWADEYDS